MRDSHARMSRDVPDVEAAMGKASTVSIDFMYLCEKGLRPTFLAIDNQSAKVCIYVFKDGSILLGDGWVQKHVALDIDNVGHKDVKVMIKSGQAKAIVALQHKLR